MVNLRTWSRGVPEPCPWLGRNFVTADSAMGLLPCGLTS